MTENSITANGMHGLTIVRKERKKKTRAKLVSIHPPLQIQQLLLPPVEHGYIKAKQYDFL